MIDYIHVQTAFDVLLRGLQFLVVAWQLRLLRRQAALPPAKKQKPKAKKTAKKKPAMMPRR